MPTITFQCYACNHVLRVDGARRGKKAKCGNCGNIVTIPVSTNMEHEVEMVPRPPPLLPDEVDVRRPTWPAITVWSILLCAGAAVLLVNAFLPWWKITVTLRTFDELRTMPKFDQDQFQRNSSQARRILSENRDWYEDHLSSRDFRRLFLLGNRGEFGLDPEYRFNKTLLGITVDGGIVGLAFGLLIIAPIVVGLFVALLRPWLWISSFVSAIFGVLMLVLGLMWVLGAPGEGAGDVLRQGIIVGPWLALGAGTIILTAGLLDGIFGLLRFIRGRRYSATAY